MALPRLLRETTCHRRMGLLAAKPAARNVRLSFTRTLPIYATGLSQFLGVPLVEISAKKRTVDASQMLLGDAFTITVSIPFLAPKNKPFWLSVLPPDDSLLTQVFMVETLAVVEQTEIRAILELFVHKCVPIEQLTSCMDVFVHSEKQPLAGYHPFPEKRLLRRDNVIHLLSYCQDGSTEIILVLSDEVAHIVYYSHGYFNEREIRIGNIRLSTSDYDNLISSYTISSINSWG